MKIEGKNKANQLYIFLSVVFITNALIAEFIGVKIFSLEKSLGLSPFAIDLFGQKNLSFQLTAGVLLWPVVFVLTDVINEYFGTKGVVRLSYLAVAMIGYAFLMVFIAIHLTPADFWIKSHLEFATDPAKKMELKSQVSNYNTAFNLVFGQGLKIIFASITAFFIGQILDAYIFHRIKKWTGEQKIWLRSTGSTLISQFFDSYIVLFIAFYFGANWPIKLVLAVGTMNYFYKLTMAILLTPAIYGLHFIIRKYLGDRLSAVLRADAMKS